jgi:regulatory protein
MDYKIRLTGTGGKKIYVDPEGMEGLYLYPGEVKKCRLTDGMILSEEDLQNLRLTYAIPRAKKRALGILVKGDRTSHQLREKLEKSLHDSQSIEAALKFVTDAGYVDDMQYARDYLHSKKHRKSYRMIRMDLMGKGISSETLDLLFEEEGDQSREDVEEAVIKYARKFPEIDRAAFGKICAHFYRKGYNPELIQAIVKESPLRFTLDI